MDGGNTYRSDIYQQAASLRRTEQTLRGASTAKASVEGVLAKGFDRVVLTGMGSSYYALYPLHLRLTSSGVSSWWMETSELIYYSSELLCPGTLVVVVSQSGRSAEVKRLVEMGTSGIALIGLTNETDSSLARAADAVIDINAGSESSVSSKTYVASIAGTYWLGDLLVSDGNRWFDAVGKAADIIAQYLGSGVAHLSELSEMLGNVKSIFFVGRGCSLATCGAAALITKESIRIPAQGLSSAGFRHGPFEIVSKESMVFVFEGDERTASLNKRLAQDITMAGGRSALVGTTGSPDCVRLPSLASHALPMIEILPVQFATLALAELGGFEAGVFRFGSKVTIDE